MPSGIGALAYVGLGKETTWGTGVAPTVFLQCLSAEAEETPEFAEANAITGRLGVLPPLDFAQQVEISLSLLLQPQPLCHLLRSLCGPPTSTQPDPTNHPTVWQHVFTFPRQTAFSDECWPHPYSVEIFRDLATTAKRYAGCGLNSLALNCDTGDKVWRAEAGLIGRGFGENVAKATVSLSTVKPWVWVGTTFKINGTVDTSQESLALEFNAQLVGRLLFNGDRRIGLLTIDGQPELTLSGTAVPTNQTEADLVGQERQFDIEVVGETISGIYAHKLTVSIPKAVYTQYSLPVEGAERIRAEWEAKAYRDSATQAVATITVVTTVPGSELA